MVRMPHGHEAIAHTEHWQMLCKENLVSTGALTGTGVGTGTSTGVCTAKMAAAIKELKTAHWTRCNRKFSLQCRPKALGDRGHLVLAGKYGDTPSVLSGVQQAQA